MRLIFGLMAFFSHGDFEFQLAFDGLFYLIEACLSDELATFVLVFRVLGGFYNLIEDRAGFGAFTQHPPLFQRATYFLWPGWDQGKPGQIYTERAFNIRYVFVVEFLPSG